MNLREHSAQQYRELIIQMIGELRNDAALDQVSPMVHRRRTAANGESRTTIAVITTTTSGKTFETFGKA